MTEVVISPEMLAAGLEALHQARLECLPEGDWVLEIYLAMRGMEIKVLCENAETLH